MKPVPGDLVTHVQGFLSDTDLIGLVLEWYDTGNGYVNVLWRSHGSSYLAPCHVDKLRCLSEKN